jgi:hypothetical protein
MDRVAVVAWCWFVVLTGLGEALGSLFGTPWMGTLLGFFSALFGTFAWPWLLPEAINAWMNQDNFAHSPARRTRR